VNVTFGSPSSSNTLNTAHGSEARVGVAVPADAELTSSTSFTPIEETQSSARSKRPERKDGDESRQAIQQERAKRQQNSQSKKATQESQDTESQEHKALDQKQVDQRAQEQRVADAQQKRQLDAEIRQIQKLAERDQEVRAHEQAHQSVGGEHTGAMSLSYERGPDGINYAVAGEVSIDTGKIADNPQATLDKAETIRRAALAPAEPSSQDRRVASQAIQMTVEAKADIQKMQQEVRTQESHEEDSDEVVDDSNKERLETDKKTQVNQQSEEVNDVSGADLQEFNDKLSRIQAQLAEISQIDEKASARVNLLDVAI
jgi:hypothetical protein